MGFNPVEWVEEKAGSVASVVNPISSIFSGGNPISSIFGGGNQGEAIKDAAMISAQGQQNALDYIKEREALPQQYRSEALNFLAGIYGLPGAESAPDEYINQILNSPLYQAGGREAEGSILRNAAATGGLRSGNTQGALADQKYKQIQDFMNGISGLASIPSNSNDIASLMAGIGDTFAQGKIAAAENKQQTYQAGFNNLLGLGSLGLRAASI